MRPETLKVKENIVKKLLDISLGKDFFNMTPKAQETGKNRQMRLIKLKSFCTPKETK